jgi:hypothetical protein
MMNMGVSQGLTVPQSLKRIVEKSAVCILPWLKNCSW